MPGWVKLHRQILNWEWYSDTNAKVLFIHCLVSANYEGKDWRGIEINPGQFYTSLNNISLALGISVKAVRTALYKLGRTNDLTYKRHGNGILVTVVKYRDWQSHEEKKGRLRSDVKADNVHSKGQQHKNKRNKEVKNVLLKKEPKSIPTFNEFLYHAVSKIPNVSELHVKLKYESWVENNWKDGNDKPIKNWKSKLTNTLQYIPNGENSLNTKKVSLY